MISAREFCREKAFPTTVFLTYSFDPLFFERIPWADLGIGGSRRIVVVADAGQVADTMRRCIGQIAYLGRRYVLADTLLTDTFHPKIIARLSAQGGRVWLGSGNLTYTGWGGNNELAVSWSVGPREDDKGWWLDELFGAVGRVVQSTTFADQLRSIREEAPWLTERLATPQPSPVLVGMRGRPLAPQLAERWRGRHFDDLKLCTGSTDVDGAFLAWMQRTFGVKRATICLTPARASFDVAKLAKLPLDIRIIPADPDSVMHAKFYWFSGPDGSAAVMGSANCSAAAWLGGNVELVVAYDSPIETEFESVLAIFRKPALPPKEVLTDAVQKPIQEDTSGTTRYRLASLRLYSSKFIEALIEPAPDHDVQANLILWHESEEITIRLEAKPWCFIGQLAAEFVAGPATMFAFAEITCGGVRYVTEPRWIDNDVALERASTPRNLDQKLEDLGRRNLFNSDQQRILEAIHAVSVQLLTPSEEERATSEQLRMRARELEHNVDTGETPVALDPAAMVRSLNELNRERQKDFSTRSFQYAGTLEGVMGMLFAQEHQQEEIDLGRETWTADEPDKAPDENAVTQAKQPMPLRPERPPADAASPEALVLFREQIHAFLNELEKGAFAEQCEASRMAQALAFPLLLCVRGSEAGWLAASELAAVATRVVDVMFHRGYGFGKLRGLFYVVQQRYAAEGRVNEFQRVVGNGTLWTVLLAALAPEANAPLRVTIPQAAALADVFQCQDLLNCTDPSNLADLVHRVVIKNAETIITERAKNIVEAVANLTKTLTASWEKLYYQQGNGRRLQPAGSLLWSRNWGWRVTPRSPAESYCVGFIRLETAAESSPELQNAINALLEACSCG